MMLEIFLGGPFPLFDSTNVVTSIIKQNDVGFPRGRLAAKRPTSGQEVSEQPVRGRGARRAPNSQDGIQLPVGCHSVGRALSIEKSAK